MQLILVAILIFWPGLVTNFISKDTPVDPVKIEIQLEEQTAPSVPSAAPDTSPGGAKDDQSAEIERMLKEQK